MYVLLSCFSWIQDFEGKKRGLKTTSQAVVQTSIKGTLLHKYNFQLVSACLNNYGWTFWAAGNWPEFQSGLYFLLKMHFEKVDSCWITTVQPLSGGYTVGIIHVTYVTEPLCNGLRKTKQIKCTGHILKIEILCIDIKRVVFSYSWLKKKGWHWTVFSKIFISFHILGLKLFILQYSHLVPDKGQRFQ